jgi:hypothetical protein
LAVVELSNEDAIPPGISHFGNPDIHDRKTELKVAEEFDHHQQNDHHVHVHVHVPV